MTPEERTNRKLGLIVRRVAKVVDLSLSPEERQKQAILLASEAWDAGWDACVDELRRVAAQKGEA